MAKIDEIEDVISVEAYKSRIRQHLYNNLPEILEAIMRLPDKEKVEKNLKLMEFVIPKVQSEQTKADENTTAGEELLAQEASYDNVDFDDDI